MKPNSTVFLPQPAWQAARMAEAIRANQHPPDCDTARYMLVEDTLLHQGVGFSARYWVSALYLAIRTNRVLLEVPVNASYPPAPIWKGKVPVVSPRWCSVAPYTLQCHYEPWSHCAVPSADMHSPPPLRGRHAVRSSLAKTGDFAGQQFVYWHLMREESVNGREPRVLRLKLHWLTWMAGPYASPPDGDYFDVAVRFLSSPRAWMPSP